MLIVDCSKLRELEALERLALAVALKQTALLAASKCLVVQAPLVLPVPPVLSEP
jgi:hypothetical protein